MIREVLSPFTSDHEKAIIIRCGALGAGTAESKARGVHSLTPRFGSECRASLVVDVLSSLGILDQKPVTAAVGQRRVIRGQRCLLVAPLGSLSASRRSHTRGIPLIHRRDQRAARECHNRSAVSADVGVLRYRSSDVGHFEGQSNCPSARG